MNKSIYLFIGAILIIILLWILHSTGVVKIYFSGSVSPYAGTACDDSKRYPNSTLPNIWTEKTKGGKPMLMDDAKIIIERFSTTLESSTGPITVSNKGTFISKRAIDQMFVRNINANGLMSYFGIDGDGKFTVVYAPTRAFQTVLTASGSIGADNIFIPETWCPNVCGIYAEFCNLQRCDPTPPIQ